MSSTDSTEPPGVTALREILSGWFNPRQGGGVMGLAADGTWGFVSAGLGQATPAQLDALFDLAGLTPKPIVPRGPCSGCRWSKDGRERGYSFPCGPCTRPWHSSFEPAEGPPTDGLGIVDRIVRRANGEATDLDGAIDSVSTGRRPPGQVGTLKEAGLSGRAAVVEAIDKMIAAS